MFKLSLYYSTSFFFPQSIKPYNNPKGSELFYFVLKYQNYLLNNSGLKAKPCLLIIIWTRPLLLKLSKYPFL
ncbi:hypothetical protein LV84_03791 [Algoriphagus ratkowskyi]|uniref:Uncharacterized protein n=1 Tax=Algoriphagus ratkowskyi TaxID=57028 RepID=A0A2W7SKN3_9BACT|nr:hypothetical protein LV84_03791 [Algoriphagus ratkowskyi]